MDALLANTWGTTLLQQTLQAVCPGLQVEVVAEVDSTSTRLRERLRSGDTTPRLLAAEAQTAGRGRLGRDWRSAPGASLTFSLALPLAPRDWSGLSLAVGVALAQALEPQGTALGLKWPNDLWLRDADGRGRKLGGVLIETVATEAGRGVVVGVGLNLRPLPADGLASGFASLHELDAALDGPACLQRVALPLLRTLLAFERGGFAGFAEAFAQRDVLRGREVDCSGAEALHGVADGVDADGALRVRSASGLHRVSGGEVSVRLVERV